MAAEILTTQRALSTLALASPYKTYHALEVALRDLWRANSGNLPAHYTSREFLTWAFGAEQVVQTSKGFVILDPLAPCPYCAPAPECFDRQEHDPMASCPKCDAWAASLAPIHAECEASVMAYVRESA